MKVERIGHIALHCTDMQKSIAFYKDAFGVEEKFYVRYSEILAGSLARHPELNPDEVPFLKELKDKGDNIWLCYLEFDDGFMLELFDSPTKDPAPNMRAMTGWQHMAIVVDSIQEAYENAVAKGIKVEGEPRIGPDNTWQFWISDPDGNQFEYMQYTDKSYQVYGNPNADKYCKSN